MVPITKDAIETGPTARCLELPSTEYINGGTKLESENYKLKIQSLLLLLYILTNPLKKKKKLTKANYGRQICKFSITNSLQNKKRKKKPKKC